MVSLNPNLSKLDSNRITDYAKNSLINEKIKKIEIEKNSKIIPNEILLSNVIADIYSSIGISSLNDFEEYLSQNEVDIQKVKEKISIEVAWNDLIVNTFANEIQIDQTQLSKELEKFDQQTVDNLLLSEIIFTINNKDELKERIKMLQTDKNFIKQTKFKYIKHCFNCMSTFIQY